MLTLSFFNARNNLRTGTNGDSRASAKRSALEHWRRRQCHARRRWTAGAFAFGKAETDTASNPFGSPEGKAFHFDRWSKNNGRTGSRRVGGMAMTYLLDANVLLAAILDSHSQHKKAD